MAGKQWRPVAETGLPLVPCGIFIPPGSLAMLRPNDRENNVGNDSKRLTHRECRERPWRITAPEPPTLSRTGASGRGRGL